MRVWFRQQGYVSVSRRPPDIEDYIDILRRYRSWIIGPDVRRAGALGGGGVLLAGYLHFHRGDAHYAAAGPGAAGPEQRQHRRWRSG